MAKFYGISVINDSTAEDISTQTGVGITAVIKLKHAALYEAAKVMGSASALARHLGISPGLMGDWINLKSCPPKDSSSSKLTSWTDERIAIMEAKLHQLTGKTWDEIWPDELRENHEFLMAPKSIEKVYNLQQAAMINYAEATRQRLMEQAGTPCEEDVYLEQQKTAVEKSLHVLPLRLRKVLKMRFGIGCEFHSLDQAGIVLGISRERVRTLEQNALRILRRHSAMFMTTQQAVH